MPARTFSPACGGLVVEQSIRTLTDYRSELYIFQHELLDCYTRNREGNIYNERKSGNLLICTKLGKNIILENIYPWSGAPAHPDPVALLRRRLHRPAGEAQCGGRGAGQLRPLGLGGASPIRLQSPTAGDGSQRGRGRPFVGRFQVLILLNVFSDHYKSFSYFI